MRGRRIPIILVAACLALSFASAQPSKPTKATNAISPVTFDAHNEGSVEGPIYGDENLVSVTIDAAGLHYLSKGQDKAVTIQWAELSGWQANNFTSRSPSRTNETGGDYGIGIYLGTRYLSFRTRSGRDYLGAVKALRTLASAKERPGTG